MQPDYYEHTATLRIGRRIVGRYVDAREAIRAYVETPELFDGPHDVAVWIGLDWHCTYHATKEGQ